MSRVSAESFVRTGGELRPIREAQRHDGSCDYVPGAISLVVDGVELLGPELWDDVNWLWPYVVQALDEGRRSGVGQRYFPDQPIVFRARSLPGPDRLQLTVTTSDRSIHRTVVAPAHELYDVVARSGIEFFRELRRLCGPDTASAKDEAALHRWLGEQEGS